MPIVSKGGRPIGFTRRRVLATGCLLCAATGKTLGRCPQEASTDSWLTVEDRVALALLRFRSGFHCAQSVLETYADELGIPPETARKLGAPLAGGGGVEGPCGAVSAGLLVLGRRHAGLTPSFGDPEREPALWERVRQFAGEFHRRHGSWRCQELLGVDPLTAEGRCAALEQNLFEKRCPEFIRDAITLLERLV